MCVCSEKGTGKDSYITITLLPFERQEEAGYEARFTELGCFEQYDNYKRCMFKNNTVHPDSPFYSSRDLEEKMGTKPHTHALS